MTFKKVLNQNFKIYNVYIKPFRLHQILLILLGRFIGLKKLQDNEHIQQSSINLVYIITGCNCERNGIFRTQLTSPLEFSRISLC